MCSCLLSVIMSFVFFHELRIIGPATVICAVVNGPIIGFFGRAMEKYLDFSPVFPKMAGLFEVKK